MDVLRHDVSGRYLKSNNASRFPRNILVFDTETRAERKGIEEYHRMEIAWTVYVQLDKDSRVELERWKFWKYRHQLCEYIRDLAQWKEKLFIVGVNIFFDLQVSGFFRAFTDWGWKLDFAYEKGSTYIITIRKDAFHITAVSMTNYLPASVKELGAMIGLPKLDIDFATASPDEECIYCFRDTEITLTAFLHYLAFVRSNDMGNFSLTRASQSMNCFRHRFMKTKLFCHSDPRILDLEERSYYGGRTEAFFIGKATGGPFVDLDINSMYPHIMKSSPMPVKAFDLYEQPTLSDLADVLKRYGAIAHVTIATDIPAYPFRSGAKVVFPVGIFETVLCTESLSYALERGHIKALHSMALYDMAHPFDEYIDYFYALRQEAKARGEDTYQRFAKLFMNSLYGKFAQRKPIEIENREEIFDGYYRREIWDTATREMVIETQLMNRLIITKGTEVMANSIYAIPSHVTDAGRLMIWKIIESLPKETVLYCDTDSIKIRESDLPLVTHPISESALGSLKVEARYRRLTIYGLKDYSTETLTRMKGVPRKAQKVGPADFKYQSWLRQSSHLRRAEDDAYIVRDITKHLSRRYTKGFVLPSGVVRPWKLPRDARRLRLAQSDSW